MRNKMRTRRIQAASLVFALLAIGDVRAAPEAASSPKSAHHSKPGKTAATKPSAPRLSLAELEAALAKTPDLYLLLDPAHRLLQVRSRGVVLDSMPLKGAEFMVHTPLFGSASAELPDLPTAWTVAEGAGDFSRELIAPDVLRPYKPEEERTVVDEARNPKVKALHDEEALPPTSYQVKMRNGWQLAVVEEEPATSFFGRYAASLSEGLDRLRGRTREHPPLLAVAMAPADARRLHHVFRSDLALLIAAGAS
jgi:hypothetical protein